MIMSGDWSHLISRQDYEIFALKQRLPLYQAFEYFSHPEEIKNLKSTYRQIPRFKDIAKRNFNYRKINPAEHPMEALYNLRLLSIQKKFAEKFMNGTLEMEADVAIRTRERIAPENIQRMIEHDEIDFVHSSGIIGSSKLTGIRVFQNKKRTKNIEVILKENLDAFIASSKTKDENLNTKKKAASAFLSYLVTLNILDASESSSENIERHLSNLGWKDEIKPRLGFRLKK